MDWTTTDQPSHSDQAQLWSGPRAIKAFYNEHFPAVRRYVLQNSGSNSDAEDVFQEAMTTLWLHAKEGRFKMTADANPGGYVFRIAKNKWLDQVRSARHRTTSATAVEDNVIAEEVDEVVEERIEHLQNIYAQLDDRCRVVLDKFYYEKEDLRTIAASMGVDEASIRTIKYRCMMKLRKFHENLKGRTVIRDIRS